MKNDPLPHGDHVLRLVGGSYIAGLTGTVNRVFVEKCIYGTVQSYYEGVGDIPPELIRKIYLTMQEISSTKMDLMEEDVLEKGG